MLVVPRSRDERPTGAIGSGVLVLALLVAGACAARAPELWDPSTGRPPPARVLLPVRGRPQARSLSCESRSAVDLLGWYGIEVTEAAFLAGLPRSDNPEHGFVGDVDDPGGGLPPAGYGAYEQPIADRLRALGLPVEASRGRDVAWLRRCVATGRPVIVWATAQLDAPVPVVLVDARGRAFPAVRGEHSFLVVGYEPGLLHLLDPATGSGKPVDERRFSASWSVLDRRAVSPTPSPAAHRQAARARAVDPLACRER